jgi:hypothetical protein
MRGLVGFMDNSSIILQSDQLRRRLTPTKLASLRARNDHRGSLQLATAERPASMIRPGPRWGEERH